MIVCVCHRVSDRDIAREVKGGCTRFEDLQATLRVATGCGACRSFAMQTLDEQLAGCHGCAGAEGCGAGARPLVAVAAAA